MLGLGWGAYVLYMASSKSGMVTHAFVERFLSGDHSACAWPHARTRNASSTRSTPYFTAALVEGMEFKSI